MSVITKKNPESFSTTLYCFSPPVMILTLFIEVIGAIYVFLRYKSTAITRLVITILICLGVFQLAEFLICTTPALPGLTWARIGYAAITLLPPLGISLAMSIADKRSRLAQITLYLAAASFIGYFLFIKDALGAETCGGNYVIFESINSMALYGFYYYSLLFIGITSCFVWAKRAKTKKIRSALIWLAIGYLSFIIPTTTVNLIDHSTTAAIPSIMCGFAILLALILIFAILPKIARPKQRSKKR